MIDVRINRIVCISIILPVDRGNQRHLDPDLDLGLDFCQPRMLFDNPSFVFVLLLPCHM